MTRVWWSPVWLWRPLLRHRRLAFFLLCWVCTGICCFVLSWRDDRFAPFRIGGMPYDTSRLIPATNRTGHFSIRRLNSKAGYKPDFSVSWTDLSVDNGRAGVFRTPLHKTIVIDRLQAKFCRYSAEEEQRTDDASSRQEGRASVGNELLPLSRHRAQLLSQGSKADDEATSPRPAPAQILSELAFELRRYLDGLELEVMPPVDVSNTTTAIVRGLDYSFFENGRLELGVRCRRAILAKSASEVVLRGCVVIAAGDDSRLMANLVEWDIERNCFWVPGIYIVERNGIMVKGRGIRCNHRLRTLGAHAASDGKGERRWARGILF